MNQLQQKINMLDRKKIMNSQTAMVFGKNHDFFHVKQKNKSLCNTCQLLPVNNPLFECEHCANKTDKAIDNEKLKR